MENSKNLLPRDTRSMTADIVAAYVSHNKVSVDKLTEVIETVYRSLEGLGKAETEGTEKREPAVPIRRSVRRDHIVCLEDGKKFRTLKRHLWVAHALGPNEYGVKWGLREDYPMVAPAYSRKRSQLAKAAGLGRSRTGGKPSRKRALKKAA